MVQAKVHLLKNRTEDVDIGKQDPYEQAIPNAQFVPVLEYHPVDLSGLIQQLSTIDNFDGIIVTSQRAVDVLKTALSETGPQASVVLQKPAYTVGSATASRLELLGFQDVRGAETGNGSALGSEMLKTLKGPQKFLFLAGEVHRDILTKALVKGGHSVETRIVYRTSPVDCVGSLKRQVNDNDWVVFFSPSHTDEIVEYIKRSGKPIRIAAIGPTTDTHLQQKGIKVDAVAKMPSAESLQEAITDRR